MTGSTAAETTQVPWSSAGLWSAAQAALQTSLVRWDHRMHQARRHAGSIAHGLDVMAALFDPLASATCAVCPNPCCRSARVWFDFQDLLFLHLHGEPLPPHQLRRDMQEACRYLAAQGCMLPRRSRPWVCAWYLCPGLREAMVREVPGAGRQIAAWQARVKVMRKAMEAAYLDALGFNRST